MRLAAERQLHPGLGAGRLQQLGLQLAFQPGIGLALLDEQLVRPGAVLDQGAGVVFPPGDAIGAQVVRQRLLPPGAVQRRDDRGEGRDGLEAAGVAQAEGQGAVAAHGMAHDRLALHVGRQLRRNQPRQFALEVAAHPVVRSPRRLRGVDIEAGPQAEVVGAVRIVRHALAARRGVGRHQHQPELGGDALGAGLHREVLLGAGQPGQEPDHRDLAVLAGRRVEDGETHRRSGLVRGVAIGDLPAAEAAALGDDLEAHAAVPSQAPCHIGPSPLLGSPPLKRQNRYSGGRVRWRSSSTTPSRRRIR